MAVGLAQKIAETLHEGIYGEQAQSDYGLTKAESKRIEEKVQKQAEEALKRVAEEFTDKRRFWKLICSMSLPKQRPKQKNSGTGGT